MYSIRFVAEDALPEGHDFVFVENGDHCMIFYRQSAAGNARVLEDSWAAYRHLLRNTPPPKPQPAPDEPPTVTLQSAS